MIRNLTVAACAVLALARPGPTSAHQPHDPIEKVAVSPQFDRDHTLLVATGALTTSLATYALLRSTSGGALWEVVRGLPDALTTAIGFSPAFDEDGTAFAASGAGLYRSVDRGGSWLPVGGGLGGVLDLAVAPDFARSGTVYTLTDRNGIGVSADRGMTFSPLAAPPGTTARIVVSPEFAADRALLAGTKEGRVYASIDAGTTWTERAATGGAAVNAFAFSPAYRTDATVFATTYGGGVWKSTDGGVRWSPTAGALPDPQATDVAPSPDFATDATLYVTTANGAFRSPDGGGSWGKLPATGRRSPQTTRHLTSLAVVHADPTRQEIFLGTFEGLWQKSADAARWTYDELVPSHIVRFLQVSPDFARDRTLVATTYGGGVLLSTDGADSWRFADTGLTNSYPSPVRFSPAFASDGILLTGVYNGLFRSPDRGGHWEPMRMMGVPVFPRAIAVPPTFAADSTVFLGTDNRGTESPPTVAYRGEEVSTQGVFSSVDRGETWTPSGLPGAPINAIEVSPEFDSDGTLFAGSVVQGLYRSEDRGRTWRAAPEITKPVLAIAVSPQFGADRTVFAGTTRDLFRSADGGATWTRLAHAGDDGAVAIALSGSFATDQTMFVATLSRGLARSSDGGWTFAALALPETYVSAVAVSPGFSADRTVFAAGYQGVYRSVTGGTSWQYTAVPARLEESRVGSVVFDGSWKRLRDPAASAAEYALTTREGASVSVEFTGTGVTWIGPTGPAMSAGDVVVDDLAAERVDLSGDRERSQVSIWERQGLPCTRHSLRITAVATGGRTGVALDAVTIARAATCLDRLGASGAPPPRR